MSMTISCPHQAQTKLRELLNTTPPHSVEQIVSVFLARNKLTESGIRKLAADKGLTLSGVMRSIMIARYPELKPLWPKPNHTPARLAGFTGRVRKPANPNADLVKHLLVYLNREENGQSERRAREFVQSQGATQDTSGRWILKGE
jgi:hypothetical protein